MSPDTTLAERRTHGAPSAPPDPPGPPPRAGERGEPAGNRDLAAALATGGALDVFVRTGVASAGGTAGVVVGALALVASGRIPNRAARVALALTPMFAIWLTLRTSPWVLLPDLAAIAALVTVAALWAGGGSLVDIAPRRLVRAAAHAALGAFDAPGFVGALARRPGRRASDRHRAVARGIVIAAPVLALLGVLLASADAMFASVFSIDPDAASLGSHGLVIGLGCIAFAMLAATARRPPPQDAIVPATPRLGAIELTVVLGGLTALFAAFAAIQAVVVTGGDRIVRRTTGLTYAEHARSGFFQLLAVAALTLLVLGAVRVVTDPDDRRAARRLTVLSEIAIALTLVIVAVAIRRLGLYQEAYGLTMLRLYATVAAVWIAAVFVLLALRVAGVGNGRDWLLPAVGALSLAVVLTLNVVNPEARVVRHNLERGHGVVGLDVGYLGRLSDDAVPALVDALPTLPPAEARAAVDQLCAAPSPAPDGWAATNLAANRAEERRAGVCGTERT